MGKTMVEELLPGSFPWETSPKKKTPKARPLHHLVTRPSVRTVAFFYPKVWIHRDCTDGGIFKCSDAAGFVGCAVLNSSWEPLILWFQDEQRDKRELSVGEIQQKVEEYNSLINTNLHMLVVSDCFCLQSTAFQNDLVTFLTLHICPPGRKKTASSPVSSRCTFS